MQWLPITYEVSSNEPAHPDANVRSRLYEESMSDCVYGCKVYADPRSNVRILIHSRIYGCMS